MGQAKRNSRSREQILAGELRCIYCKTEPPQTIEHMPPVCMFPKGQRPSGLEFATCTACNNGTRGADVVAAFFARLSRMSRLDDELTQEAFALSHALEKDAPGVLAEFKHGNRHTPVWVRDEGVILQRGYETEVGGPRIDGHLDAFSAKLGMALYREHTGHALPLDGTVRFIWYLNSGLTEEYVKVLFDMLPALDGLKQGKKSSAGLFDYRYNTNGENVVATFSHFYQGLAVFAVASHDPRWQRAFSEMPESKAIRPGELLSLIPPPPSRIPKTTKRLILPNPR